MRNLACSSKCLLNSFVEAFLRSHNRRARVRSSSKARSKAASPIKIKVTRTLATLAPKTIKKRSKLRASFPWRWCIRSQATSTTRSCSLWKVSRLPTFSTSQISFKVIRGVVWTCSRSFKCSHQPSSASKFSIRSQWHYRLSVTHTSKLYQWQDLLKVMLSKCRKRRRKPQNRAHRWKIEMWCTKIEARMVRSPRSSLGLVRTKQPVRASSD